MTTLTAFEDPNHEGNSAAYHTGKPCRTKGCTAPAGTWWSPHWCFAHNVERIKRIESGLNDAALTMRLRKMVNDETESLRAFCERLRRERDTAAQIVWRRITDADKVDGKEVLLSRGQPYGVHKGCWRDARTEDRGPPHARPYVYKAGWHYGSRAMPVDELNGPFWIADIPPAPSVPDDAP